VEIYVLKHGEFQKKLIIKTIKLVQQEQLAQMVKNVVKQLQHKTLQ
jgi:hypothetical protein